MSFDSGVRAAVDGQVCTGDVRRLRTGHERYQRGDLVNLSVAVERCVGNLGRGPIARGGIQIRVDRTRLDTVDRDAPGTNLSGQALREHLDGPFCRRIRREAGRHVAFAYARTDCDDATAALHVLQGCLRRNERRGC